MQTNTTVKPLTVKQDLYLLYKVFLGFYNGKKELRLIVNFPQFFRSDDVKNLDLWTSRQKLFIDYYDKFQKKNNF